MPALSYQYLTRHRGVRSGQPIAEGTRIGVHDVIALTATGATVDDAPNQERVFKLRPH